MESRTPKFCSVCGSKLVANEVVQGYDPYTGDPLAETSLSCPNPTVVSRPRLIGYASTETTYHPSWVNENGVWSQLN